MRDLHKRHVHCVSLGSDTILKCTWFDECDVLSTDSSGANGRVNPCCGVGVGWGGVACEMNIRLGMGGWGLLPLLGPRGV